MPIAPPADRVGYVGTGRVRLMSLLWGAIMGASLSLVVSAAMMGIGWTGFYIIGLVPLVAGMAVGGLAYLVVYQSHCRNKALAGLLGFCMGAMAYLGYYHLDFLSHVGFNKWHRIDVLPAYLQLRWENDVVGKPGRDGGAANYWMNMIISIGELCAMGAISAVMASRAGSKPYAENALCWMNSAKFFCASGSSGPITAALAARSLSQFQAALVPSPKDDQGYNECELWYCASHRDPDRVEPIYLSMTENGPANKDGNRNTALIIEYWQLDADELAVLARAVPGDIAQILAERGDVAPTEDASDVHLNPPDTPEVS